MLAGLGEDFELMANTYKPFPCGLVIHPAIDGVLRLREGARSRRDRRSSGSPSMRARPPSPFGNRPDPQNDLEAKVSLHHWVAVAAATGRAGIAEGRPEVVVDPRIRAMRRAVTADRGPGRLRPWPRGFASAKDGSVLADRCRALSGQFRGNPMTDADLSAKCRAQAEPMLGRERAAELAELCWRLDRLPDAGEVARKGELKAAAVGGRIGLRRSGWTWG